MRTTDAEHVARIRLAVARLDRARPWLVAWWLVLAVVWLGALIGFGVRINSMVNANAGNGNFPFPPWLSAPIGLGLGASLGLSGTHIAHHLVETLLGLRTERLLLRYHDELAAQRGDSDDGSLDA